jgi:hypothetical protein
MACARDALGRLLAERAAHAKADHARVQADLSFAMTAAELSPEVRGQIMRLLDLVGDAGFDAVSALVIGVFDEATVLAQDDQPPY